MRKYIFTSWMYWRCFFLPPSTNTFEWPTALYSFPFSEYSTIDSFVASTVDHTTTISRTFSVKCYWNQWKINWTHWTTIFFSLKYEPPNAIWTCSGCTSKTRANWPWAHIKNNKINGTLLLFIFLDILSLYLYFLYVLWPFSWYSAYIIWLMINSLFMFFLCDYCALSNNEISVKNITKSYLLSTFHDPKFDFTKMFTPVKCLFHALNYNQNKFSSKTFSRYKGINIDKILLFSKGRVWHFAWQHVLQPLTDEMSYELFHWFRLCNLFNSL